MQSYYCQSPPEPLKKITLIQFLNEHRTKDYLFASSNLPEFFNIPTVTLTIQQLTRFRNDYRALLEFIAFILNKKSETVCVSDMFAYILKILGNRE